MIDNIQKPCPYCGSFNTSLENEYTNAYFYIPNDRQYEYIEHCNNCGMRWHAENRDEIEKINRSQEYRI